MAQPISACQFKTHRILEKNVHELKDSGFSAYRDQSAADPAQHGYSNRDLRGQITDQCVSSKMRSLEDESFEVLVVEDRCAAATDDLHEHELKVINMIYCHVVSLSHDRVGERLHEVMQLTGKLRTVR